MMMMMIDKRYVRVFRIHTTGDEGRDQSTDDGQEQDGREIRKEALAQYSSVVCASNELIPMKTG